MDTVTRTERGKFVALINNHIKTNIFFFHFLNSGCVSSQYDNRFATFVYLYLHNFMENN
jgi:hypothetical protein